MQFTMASAPTYLIMTIQQLNDKIRSENLNRASFEEFVRQNGGTLAVVPFPMVEEQIEHIRKAIPEMLIEIKEVNKASFAGDEIIVLDICDLPTNLQRHLHKVENGHGSYFPSTATDSFDESLIDPALRDEGRVQTDKAVEEACAALGFHPESIAHLNFDEHIDLTHFEDDEQQQVAKRQEQADIMNSIFARARLHNHPPRPSGAPQHYTSQGEYVPDVQHQISFLADDVRKLQQSQLRGLPPHAYEAYPNAENVDFHQAREDLGSAPWFNTKAAPVWSPNPASNPFEGQPLNAEHPNFGDHFGNFGDLGAGNLVNFHGAGIPQGKPWQLAQQGGLQRDIGQPQQRTLADLLGEENRRDQPQALRQSKKRNLEEVDDSEVVESEQAAGSKIVVLGRRRKVQGRGFRFQFLVNKTVDAQVADGQKESTPSGDDDDSALWMNEIKFVETYGAYAEAIIAEIDQRHPRDLQPDVEGVFFPPSVLPKRNRNKKQRKFKGEATHPGLHERESPVEEQATDEGFTFLSDRNHKGDILAITGRKSKRQGPGFRYLYCLSVAATTDSPAMEVWARYPDILKAYGPLARTLMSRFDEQYDRKAHHDVRGKQFLAPIPISGLPTTTENADNAEETANAIITSRNPVDLKSATIASFLARRNKRQGSGWRWLILVELGGDYAGQTQWCAEKDLIRERGAWANEHLARFDMAYPKATQERQHDEYLYLDQPFAV